MNLTPWIKRRPLIAFFVLAYAISWLILAPLVIMGESVASFSLLFIVVSAFGPALAALVVTRIVDGREGVRRWAGRLTRWRVHVGWYLIAFLIPFFLVLLGYGLYLLLGGSPVDDWHPPSPGIFLATVLFLLFLGGGQEEPGWRGFALPRLQARYSALMSSLILGLVWAFWHIPVFLAPGTIQSEQPFLWYLLLILAMTILFTWIFNNTRGSVLPVMLSHAAVNTAPGLLPLDMRGGRVSMRNAVLMAAWLLVAIVVAVFGPARLHRTSEGGG